MGQGTILLSRKGEGKRLVLIRWCSDQRPIQRLDSLCFGKRRLQITGDIEGDVVSTYRDCIGVEKLSFRKNRDRGGAAADVDAGDPERRSSSLVAASALA